MKSLQAVVLVALFGLLTPLTAHAADVRLGLGAVAEVEDPRRDGPLRQVAHPIAFSETPATYRSAPPRPDEDGAELRQLLARYAQQAQSRGTR